MNDIWLCGNSEVCTASEYCSHGSAHKHNGGCILECSSFGSVKIKTACRMKYKAVALLEEELFEI